MMQIDLTKLPSMPMKRLHWLIFFLFSTFASSANAYQSDSMLKPTALGSWGGERIRMIVSAGGATIEYDCARGTIDEPLMVDKNGKFEANGCHVSERGGPVRLGEPLPERHPAQYHGWTDGRQMRLTVELLDTGESVGTFTLDLGRSPLLDKCL